VIARSEVPLRNIKIGLAQIAPRLGDVNANLQKHLDYIGQAREQGVGLLLFPELSITGYSVRDLTPDVALPARADDPVFARLLAAAGDMDVVVGFVEQSSRYLYYNSAAYLSAGQLWHVYRKVYLPTFTLFDESRFWAAGDRLRAFDTRFGRVALTICRDAWQASMAYLSVMDGADLILTISAAPGWSSTPAEPRLSRALGWDDLIRHTANIFTVYYAYCNRVGVEDGVSFSGGSILAGPAGNAVTRAPDMEEALVTATVDARALDRQRQRSPFLRDEKLDLVRRELDRIARERGEGFER
jgi:NAD+ synthase (glutamine-hydrolysing)